MKKLYIQPLVEFEAIEASDILAGSPTVDGNDFTNNDFGNLDGKLEGSDDDDQFGAKGGSTFVWDEESI